MGRGLRASLLIASMAALSTPAFAQIATGTYNGDGLPGRSISVGFRPVFVFIKVDYENVADNNLSAAVVRTATMTGDNTKPLSGNQALTAGLITSLDANGFTVDTDLRVNAAGAACGGTCSYYWTAFGQDPDFTIGTYTGNGTSVGDPQSITGLGFSPEYVMVFPGSNRRARHRTTAGGTASRRMSPNGSVEMDQITSMDADGFTVKYGANAIDNQNENGQAYHYAAWNEVPGKMVTGEYLGDGVNNRQIIGTSFSPSWVILTAYDDGKDAIHRTKDMAMDAGSSFRKAIQANYVRALLPNGFQVGSSNVVNEAGFNFFWVAFGESALCPPMTVSETATTITTTAAGSFELRFNSGVGGGIDQWYELNRDPDRSENLMNNTGSGSEYGLNEFALWKSPTDYQLNGEPSAALNLIEVTPVRTLVRAEGQLGNFAGYDYRQDTAIHNTGKTYSRMEFTNNTGGTLSAYEVNWYNGTDYSANWLGLTDPSGALSDATEPLPYTDDFALKYTTNAAPADEHYGNILFIPSRDYTEFSETGWMWKNDSLANSGYIKLTGTETWASGAGITVMHNTVLKPDSIASITDARPFADDYRTPDALNVTTGSEWFDASENTAGPSDAFNEAEGVYTLDFDPAAGLVFDIDGGTTERLAPAYKIRQWRSLGGASSVTFNGAQTTWQVQTQTGDATSQASNNAILETHRYLIKQPFIVRGGSQFRVKLKAHASLPAPGLANFHIAEVDPGDDRNVVDATWTQVTFTGGSTTVSLVAGMSVWSDWITFNLDPAKTYSLTFFMPLNSASSEWQGCGGCGIQKYLTVGADSSAILDWSGIGPSTSTRIDFVEELEVRGAQPLSSGSYESGVKPFTSAFFCDPACTALAHGGLTTDNDEYLASPTRNLQLGFSGSDGLWLGTNAQFRGINVSLQIPGAGTADLQWEYWNGAVWANLEAVSGFTDETNSLTRDGTIYWTADPPGWAPTSINGSPELYYVRTQLASGTYSTPPTEHLIKTDILLFRYCGTLAQDAQQFNFAVPVPTAVELASFSARSGADHIVVAWRTATELDNLGFELYRSQSQAGPYERVTSRTIPGLGSSPVGASYRYVDRDVHAPGTYYYELEDIDTSGETARHGPIVATLGGHEETIPNEPEPDPEPEPDIGIHYGKPEEASLRILKRTKRYLVLELTTPGFHAYPADDGSVRFEIPGFANESALPVKRYRVDGAVAIASARASRTRRFSGLEPGSDALEVVATTEGSVRLRRIRGQRTVSSDLARAVEPGLIELAPLRWDASRGEVVLVERLVVRLKLPRVPRTGARRQRGSLAARIHTTEPGIYAVDLTSVLRRSRALRLSRQGVDVPFHIDRSQAQLYFVSGGAADNPYGTEAVYELEAGVAGREMTTLSAAPAGSTVPFYWETVRHEDDLYYQAALVDAPDRWLGDVLLAPAETRYRFETRAVVPGAATLRLRLQGASDVARADDHHVRAFVNDTLVGDASWNGKRAHTIEASVDASLLRDGTNELRVENVGDAGAPYSMVMVDAFEMRYPRRPELIGGQLAGTWPRRGYADIATPSRPVVIAESASTTWWVAGFESSPNGVRLSVEPEHLYHVVTAPLTPTVERVTRQPELLTSRRRAAWLVIGPRAFLDAAEPLVEHRRSQGLRARAVSTEDIFASFGHGERNPEAIHAFLRHVYHEWREPRLRYVLLLGDGSYDFKTRLGTGVANDVPPNLVRTRFLWTASDPSYAAVDGDDRYPDVAIGRIPASNVREVEIAVSKILEYERTGSLDGTFVLVADDADEAGDFEARANELSRTLLAAEHNKHVYLRELGAAGVRAEVTSAFETGSAVISYMGHGGIHLWADENVFNINDVSALSPHTELPIVLTMNCLNGFFHFPYFDAMAEALVVAEDKGAIAAISPTGLSLDGPAHELHRAILSELVSGRHATLGDAFLAAQNAYAETGVMPELVSIYHLFGDPALALR